VERLWSATGCSRRRPSGEVMECYWLFSEETEWRGYGVLLVVLGEDRVVRIWSAAGCSRWRPSGEAMECYWLFSAKTEC